MIPVHVVFTKNDGVVSRPGRSSILVRTIIISIERIIRKLNSIHYCNASMGDDGGDGSLVQGQHRYGKKKGWNIQFKVV